MMEEIASPEIESGLRTQLFNNRGVTSRMPADGGEQERMLAEKYREDADKINDTAPRTASVLRNLADGYKNDAGRQDDRADLTQDFWR
jgi:hypothetical protein